MSVRVVDGLEMIDINQHQSKTLAVPNPTLPLVGKTLVEATGSGTTAIFLPPGDHTLDNPVVINRSGSVYIHGSGRIHNTRLIANDPTQPLFLIESAAVVNFANLNLYGTFDADPDPSSYPPGEGPDLEARAVLMNNTTPVTLELQFCGVHSGVLDIKGPGTVRLE